MQRAERTIILSTPTEKKSDGTQIFGSTHLRGQTLDPTSLDMKLEQTEDPNPDVTQLK